METNSNNYLVRIYKGTAIETVAYYEDGSLVFNDEKMKRVMSNLGVQIPAAERGNYQNKAFVRLNDGDNLFERAFREVYCEYYLSKDEYQWQDLSDNPPY